MLARHDGHETWRLMLVGPNIGTLAAAVAVADPYLGGLLGEVALVGVALVTLLLVVDIVVDIAVVGQLQRMLY
jgi:hypothetical protein